MKLVFDNIIFSLQKAGGISVVWYEMLKRALADEEIDITLIETKNQNIFRKLLQVPKDRIRPTSLRKLPLKIRRYLDPKFKDVNAIFHSSYYRLGRGKNIKNVTTVHDFTYEYYRTGIARLLHSYQKGRAIKGADKIICVSENTKKDLLKFYPQVNPQKIAVVYNGVSELFQPFSQDLETELNRLTIFKCNEYVLFVGDRKSTYKNFHIAVEACVKSKKKLVTVGGGKLSESEEIMLSNKLGYNRYQHVNGISTEALNVLYNGALCLVYPSSYEGFGIPVIEAQKAGCPVIAINISSIPEVMGDIDTLLPHLNINDISEKINKIYEESEYRNVLIKKGFANANRFSWDICYKKTKEIYQELLSS